MSRCQYRKIARGKLIFLLTVLFLKQKRKPWSVVDYEFNQLLVANGHQVSVRMSRCQYRNIAKDKLIFPLTVLFLKQKRKPWSVVDYESNQLLVANGHQVSVRMSRCQYRNIAKDKLIFPLTVLFLKQKSI